MAIFNGKNLKIEIYGESHQEKIGAKVNGAPKFSFDESRLKEFLERRKASSSVFSTSRKESDEPNFINVKDNTIGGDFEVVIYNNNTNFQIISFKLWFVSFNDDMHNLYIVIFNVKK